MLRKIIILNLLILLASCSDLHYKNQYNWTQANLSSNAETLLNDTDSILIFSLETSNLTNDLIYDNKLKTIGAGWINENSNQLLYTLDSSNKIKTSKVEPGKYFLENVGNIAMVDRINIYHSPILALVEDLKLGQAWTSSKYLKDGNENVLSASFFVNPREIVYVGDIVVTVIPYQSWLNPFSSWTNDKIKIEIKDNYNEAVKQFRKKYPQFKNKAVAKRLIKLGAIFNEEGVAKFFNSPMSQMRNLK